MFKLTTLTVNRRLPRILALEKCSIHQTETKTHEKEVQEIKIPVPWGHIAGKWWGRTDIQPLLGLHGWEDNAGTFDNLAPLLKVNSFLAIDLPGHGLSSHFPIGRPYYFMDSVLTIRHIVKYFKWDKLSVIGHSYGSCTAFAYSAIFPDDVDNYISIDCARTLMAPDKETELLHLMHIGDKLVSVEDKLVNSTPPSYSYDTIVDLLYKGSLESPSKESCKILLQRGMIKSDSVDDGYYFSRDPRLRYHALVRLPNEYLLTLAPKIKCNHLSIRGKEGLIFGGSKEEVYFKTFERIKKPNYRVEHHDVEGTHHLHLNNAERVAPIVNKFLSDVRLSHL